MSRNHILVGVGLAEEPSSFRILVQEWVEYHLMLGAQHISLYLHLSADESGPQLPQLVSFDLFRFEF